MERGAGGSEAGKVGASASMEEEGDRGNLRRRGFLCRYLSLFVCPFLGRGQNR